MAPISKDAVGHVGCEEEGIPIAMRRPGRILFAHALLCGGLSLLTGCVSMRRDAPSVDLRPCSDGFAYTEDGWRLGVRHYRSPNPDPGKLPVVLCHGLGLNATFWTITDNHLASQMAARGYDVFLFDFRGAGENSQVGRHDRINKVMRHTFLRECGERDWNVDDLVHYDVPAILDYVQRQTGRDRVNWVGHSLGGMLIFPYLELARTPSGLPTSSEWEARSSRRRSHRKTCLPPIAGCGCCLFSPVRDASAGRWRSFACRGWT